MDNKTKWIGAALVVILVIAGSLVYAKANNNDDQAEASGQDQEPPVPDLGPADPGLNPDATLVVLEDPGPGRCWPDILGPVRAQAQDGDFDDFEGLGDFTSPYTSEEKEYLHDVVLVWVDANWNKPCVRAQAQFVDDHAEWYDVNTVLLAKWNREAPDDQQREGWDFSPDSKGQFLTYLSLMRLDDLEVPSVWQNHAFRDGGWVSIGKQAFPSGELLFFVPGYHPGNKEGRELRAGFKFVCGNPLLPPAKEKEGEPRAAKPIPPATPGKPKPPGDTPKVTVPNDRKPAVPVPGPGGPDSPQAPDTDFAPPDKPEDHDFDRCKVTGYCGQTKPQTPITTTTTEAPPQVTAPVTTPATGEDNTGIVDGP
jgi:hypothetical protein